MRHADCAIVIDAIGLGTVTPIESRNARGNAIALTSTWGISGLSGSRFRVQAWSGEVRIL
jgi:hypothetical protein